MSELGKTIALIQALKLGPTDAQVTAAVDDWLDDHPDATTTVTDGSITNAKLATSFVTPGTASAYSSSATYAVGDYVFYNGALYRCISAISTAEAWTAAHWTAAVLGEDVGGLRSQIDYLNDELIGDVKYSRTISQASDSINANNSKTNVTAVSGQKIVVNVHGSAFADGARFALYFFINDVATSQGNITEGEDNEYTLSSDISAVGIYAVNLSYPSVVQIDVMVKADNGFLAQAKAAITEIGVIDQYLSCPSRNVFNVKWANAKYISGVYTPITSGKNNVATEHISVEPSTYYTLSWDASVASGATLYFLQFASDKSQIKQDTIQTRYGIKTLLLEATTAYVAFQIYKDTEPFANLIPSWTQLEVGDIASAYVESNVLSKTKADAVVLNNYAKGIEGLPSYYHDKGYIEGKFATIETALNGCIANGDAFIFSTDQHWGLNEQKSISLINAVSNRCKIPRLITGGDSDDYASADFYERINRNFNGKIYNLMGNHDWMSPTTTNELFNMADLGKSEQVGNPIEHYYYVDNPQQKIRYIMLNAFVRLSGNSVISGYNQNQLDWLNADALNAKPDWDYIVFTHWIGTMTAGSMSGASDFRDALDAFNADSSNEGKIIGIIQGHAHYDAIFHTTGGIPIITTTCDKNVAWISDSTDMEPWITSDRISGTTSEQAFDVMVLNKTAKTITAIRIGALAMPNVDVEPNNAGWTYGGTLEQRVISYA